MQAKWISSLGMGCILMAAFAQPSPGAEAAATSTNAPPITITAGAEWLPVTPELEIEPGSVLDFSNLNGANNPAGSHGRVMVRPNGQFAFADSIRTTQRFYGVNLCFSAQYLAHEEADCLATRLARIGYNALRIHHYERDLVEATSEAPGFRLRPDRLDQLDYLLAACAKQGIYITTDLFVSRPVRYADLGIDKPGQVPMDAFKILIPVHAGAFENWKAFARQFLTHTNPYTGLSYAADPALAWLSLINEGNFGNFLKEMQDIPEWKSAWNTWLAGRYASRQELAAAWKEELKASEDWQAVNLPESIYAHTPRARDYLIFLAEKERDMVARMKAFLRDELGCGALITNDNAWTNHPLGQNTRALFDYVDDHFYVDHPEFIERPWQLPSRCANASPLLNGVRALRSRGFTRLYDKPFTITEYNFSGPGRFRGIGGILTGAYGALQGWGGIWRFAYSHSREGVIRPAPMNYFDVASDPLSLAAERASLCLFLRGDLRSAPRSVTIAMTTNDLAHPPAVIPKLDPAWSWVGWLTRVGTEIHDQPIIRPRAAIAFPLGWSDPASAYSSKGVVNFDPYRLETNQMLQLVRDTGILRPDNLSDPGRQYFRSETGEITLDGTGDMMILDTPRTAGGFARAGSRLETKSGGVNLDIQGSDATVWISSLEPTPIRNSRRLLVTHLTDLQNTGVEYRESERKTLLKWGHLPYLMRAGQARVQIHLLKAKRYQVWGLTPGGRRVGLIPATAQGDVLTFTADMAALPGNGATFLYEIARP